MRKAFQALAVVSAVLALACIAFAVVVALYGGPDRIALVGVTNAAASLLPPFVRGIGVMPLPTGGSLRCDFLLMGVIFFVLRKIFLVCSDRADS